MTNKKSNLTESQLRKSSQFIMPVKLTRPLSADHEYNIYPVHALGNNKIFNGYESLSQWIISQKTVIIDGYSGIFWDKVQSSLDFYFNNAGIKVNWIISSAYLKKSSEIASLVSPFLGAKDAVWGTKCSLTLADLYEVKRLEEQIPDHQAEINIVIGTGAALSGWDAPLVYLDLPKNELQFRMRAGAVTNLGTDQIHPPFYIYKRSYFVDWVLLNKHKKEILNKIIVVADGQWENDLNWMFKSDLAAGLNKMSEAVIRVRPWFEPGVWGGQWIKEHINNINKEVINYAWSFELIVPENGLIFESDGYLLEVSFDFLMFQHSEKVLGKHAQLFGDEFPIRFDFLDTFDGGNLSIQCHPRLKYIQEEFGERITQDETYYILDCQKDAKVYLGFQENIDPEAFRKTLENSQAKNKEIIIGDYVQVHTARKHDLFLIPNGTVHSAGAGNLVLEISATPYIFTFKMYDWLRLDLEGKPRPINIDHAFKNLDFDKKGDRVQEELLSKPVVTASGKDWQIIHLPTHQDHFYDVHRIEFEEEISIRTENCCHVMMLVEGQAITIQTLDGTKQTYAYAETFVVPAAAQSYTLTNQGNGPVKVIKAFLK